MGLIDWAKKKLQGAGNFVAGLLHGAQQVAGNIINQQKQLPAPAKKIIDIAARSNPVTAPMVAATQAAQNIIPQSVVAAPQPSPSGPLPTPPPPVGILPPPTVTDAPMADPGFYNPRAPGGYMNQLPGADGAKGDITGGLGRYTAPPVRMPTLQAPVHVGDDGPVRSWQSVEPNMPVRRRFNRNNPPLSWS